MDCKNHPGVMATNRCAGCAEPFCNNCVVNLQGQPYCASCKTMTVANAPMVEAATIPSKEATQALICAIVGLFCFGIILGPIALVLASKASKMMKLNPRITGSGKLMATYILAPIDIIGWAYYMYSHVWAVAHH